VFVDVCKKKQSRRENANMWKNWVVLILAVWVVVSAFILKESFVAKLFKAILPGVIIIVLALWVALSGAM